MIRKRTKTALANHERWLVSYADFITLLFAFFVVLYAFAEVDKAKMSKLSVAIEGAFKQMGVFNKSGAAGWSDDAKGDDNPAANATGTAPLNEQSKDASNALNTAPAIEAEPQFSTRPQMRSLRRELEELLAVEIKKREVALHFGPEGLVVSLREVGFFDSGSSTLKPGSEVSLGRMAALLRDKKAAIRVEGHTDNVPIHNAQFNSNWELSTARATEIIKLLIVKYDFPPERLSAAGYGEFHPIAANTSAEGRRQNRRLDLVILAAPGQDQSGDWDGIETSLPRTVRQQRVFRAGAGY